MKAMRYILSLVAIVSVMGVSAATYGTSHRPRYRRVISHQVEAQTDMPVALMNPMNSLVMQSGTTLPFAAVTGTVVTGNTLGEYSSANTPGGPRKIGGSGSGTGGNEAEETTDPFEDPLGDGILPLMMMAVAFGLFVYRRRKQTLNC